MSAEDKDTIRYVKIHDIEAYYYYNNYNIVYSINAICKVYFDFFNN